MSSLYDELKNYGTPDQVSNTVKLIEANNSWEGFMTSRNSKEHWNYISPYANRFEDIVKEYYKNKDNKKNSFFSWSSDKNPPPPSSNDPPQIYGYTYVRTDRLPTGSYSHFLEGNKLEDWDVYERPLGLGKVSIKRKEGGKRKTHRKQKTNKYKKRKNKSRKIKKKYL